MKPRVQSYRAEHLPDPHYRPYQSACGGDVRAAVSREIEHLLRILADLPAQSVRLFLRWTYLPLLANQELQSRLTLNLAIVGENASCVEIVAKALECGSLPRLYGLRSSRLADAPWEQLAAACDILRREDAVEPLHPVELNDRSLAFYYSLQAFQPNTENDYIHLENVLGSLNEAAVLELCVEPAETSAEFHAHTQYLAQLHSINRSWDTDDEDYSSEMIYAGDEGRSWAPRPTVLTPLRCRDPLADDLLRRQQRFHETLNRRNLRFQLRVLAESSATAHLLASVIAESGFKDGSYRLFDYARDDLLHEKALKASRELRLEPFFTHERLFQERRPDLYTGLKRLAHLASVEELMGVFRLPVASCASPSCVRKNTDPAPADVTGLIILGYDEEPIDRRRKRADKRIPRGTPLAQLTKHGFITGVPGSGKTTAMFNIMVQLHLRGIPFLVIEPVKTEYRELKSLLKHRRRRWRRLAQALRVFTLGNEPVSPFRHNPFQLLPGIARDEHIDNLLNCFLAAMPIAGPLPAILGEALEQVYDNFPDPLRPPCLRDLVDATYQVFNRKGYSAETAADFRTALEVRLQNLTRRSVGRIFQCRESIPDLDSLMTHPTILEMDRLSEDQACLMSLFILTAIREALKTTPAVRDGPRLVIFLEEAHVILGRSAEAAPSEEFADPKSFATQSVCRMLAELRALGAGLIIADQLASAIAPEVIKNTSFKLAFRQVAADDRELLGNTMLFGESEYEDIARLETGEAFIFREGYHGPRRIQTIGMNEELEVDGDSC